VTILIKRFIWLTQQDAFTENHYTLVVSQNIINDLKSQAAEHCVSEASAGINTALLRSA
jgi:hypothetical protein